MRILADYRRWGYRKWAFLSTMLEIKDLNLKGKVDFLLDTGAGETILSEKDAQRIGLAYRNLPKGSGAQGVGGRANTWRIDKKITLYISTVGGGIYEASRRNVEVLEEPSEEKTLPSLLGLEFLEQLNLKLTFDMPIIAIYLEI